jgi:hypothetical protein
MTALIFWGASRFRYPVEGLCIILASATLVWLCEKIAQRFTRRRVAHGRPGAD